MVWAILAFAAAGLAAMIWLGQRVRRQGRIERGLARWLLIGLLILGATLLLARGSWPLALLGFAASLWAWSLPGRTSHPQGDEGDTPRPNASAMSREEALAILGLERSASEADIQAAYKRLMLGVHPDKGGSAHLAAKLNAARDRLLS
ncbi:MAG: DnaJ domain-containing protein [Asticcacaulis sp.]